MELINTYPVKKSDLGFHGNLFGGNLLKWLDSSAAAFAMQACDTPRVVTIKIDECLFKKPAKEGQLLKVYGKVDGVGNTSIKLYIEARAHNVYTGNQTTVVSTYITFVRIDEDGNAIPISERVKRKYDQKS